MPPKRDTQLDAKQAADLDSSLPFYDAHISEEEDMAVRLAALKNTLRTQKGHLTKTIQKANDIALFARENTITDFTLEELQRAVMKVHNAEDRISHVYEKIMTLDPGNFDSYDAKLQDELKRASKVNETLYKLIADTRLRPSARRTVPESLSHTRAKPNESLKPFTLTRDATPVQVRQWIDAFRAWYSSSSMDKCTLEEQHAYFKICLEQELVSRINSKITRDLPVFGETDSCIAILKAEFLLRYPLFTRRVEFFKHTQVKGQLLSDFCSELRAKGEEADLFNLSTEDLYIFRIIGGCTDDTIKRKLLKLDNPTLQDIEKEILAYEVASNALQNLNDRRSFANRVRSGNGRGYGRGHGRGGGRGRHPGSQGGWTKQSLKAAGKCLRCGSTDHPSNSCPRRENLVCNICRKKGHLSTVCLSHGRPQSSAPSRGNTRPPSPSHKQQSMAQVSSIVCRLGRAVRVDHPTPTLEVEFIHSRGSFRVKATPDTGATRTIVSASLLKRNNVEISCESKAKLFTADGKRMPCEGEIKFTARCAGQTAEINAIVSSALQDEILVSWHDLQSLGIISKEFPAPIHAKQIITDFSKLMETFATEFEDVMRDTLSNEPMSGEPMVIRLKDNVDIVPRKCLTARQVPLHWTEEANKIIEKAVSDGVIEPVTEPTKWISPAFFVPKEGGKNGLRLVTDFTQLNKFVERPVHPFPSAMDILRNISSDSKFFCKMDAIQGYFQIPLEENSSKLTTFLLPSGKYRYKRAPMGLNASSDEWCARSDAALQGIPGVSKLVDDILVEAPDIETLSTRIREVLTRCKQHKIIISRKKFQVGTKIKFAGYVVSDKGILPDPEKTAAIADFPTPTDLTSLRSFLGLANQLGNFLPDLAHASGNLRQLLKKGVAFNWLPEHQEEFENLKKVLTSSLVVKPFDPQLKTELLTDASRLKGLGFALVQRQADGQIHLVECGSRSLIPAESRYATIELECLAIQWAIFKCTFYLLGTEFSVVTDHRPLIGIFQKPLDQLENNRLQRLREKLTSFCFKVTWTAGKTHCIADALSRAPVFAPSEEEDPNATDFTVCNRVAADPAMQVLFDAIEDDDDYKRLIRALRENVASDQFRSIWHNLSLFDDEEITLVLYDSSRIVVPAPARKEILKLLHQSHSGQVKTKKLAQQLYYWPGMTNNIRQMIEACSLCQELRPSLPKEPLMMSPPAELPMSHVATDLFSYAGKSWLVMVDRYSGFPFVKQLTRLDAPSVTKTLKSWFDDWGFPKVIRSDGGPQFRTHFEDFCRRHHILHEKTSPYNSQSNGLAEAAVKNVKHLLVKCVTGHEDFAEALSAWRNTPRPDGFSPAQLFLGRAQRTALPRLTPGTIIPAEAESARQKQLQLAKQHSDRNKRPLGQLKVNDRVLVQDPISHSWNIRGVVQAIRDDQRSFTILADNGKVMIRNRRFLKRIDSKTEGGEPAHEDVKMHNPRRSERLAEKTKKKVSFSL